MTATVMSLAARAEAGEVNAREELRRIGGGVAAGYSFVDRARAVASRFGEALSIEPAVFEPRGPHPEAGKPPLPAGALGGLKDASSFASTVLRSRKHRDGVWACAIVIASGPRLDAAQIQRMARGMGLSATQARCFEHAVRFASDAACRQLARGVGPAERCAIAIGQCVGRARMLQAARSNARMGPVNEVIGIEMGERAGQP